MKAVTNIYKTLPFIQTFPSKFNHFLKVKTITRNLGSTFYPRLISIYKNIVEAIISSNKTYLQNSVGPQLASQLMKQRQQLHTMGFKLKINQPHIKLLPFKNYILPQTAFRNDNFYISVACKVYFGGYYDPIRAANSSEQKLFRFGKFRYLIWNKSLSLRENLKNIYNIQSYEFIVRYQSNLYITLQDINNKSTYQKQKKVVSEQDDMQDLRTTEIVLRSGNQKFDWIIIDINGMIRNKS